ncbi:NAD(P)-binding protein [Phytohabitans aurantiacus]|uniref:Glutamate synthase n=1 Tax=Phytohabitans aurantiacus TaxID=3016789 RepID=A0ABQ5QZL8_9ACTN|nr:NAD(P)-binding protein [Phytohabitans aurantiacus]GLH99740.1 glutamate synthase [Phytohabitans aurantiacus]
MERPFAITLEVGSSLANHTGAWRTERPVYADKLPPCNDACPAGENVQRWLYEAEDGHYERAWRELMRDNPFPAIMGRVCYHPCQTACNRGKLDEAVGINAVERFLGDEAIRQGWTVPVTAAPTGKRVLVVGAGPSGLAAAYHLRLAGHEVTVRDAGRRPGGMMRYGIPAYRLGRDVLDAEIDRILAMGVTFEPETPVTDAAAALADFDAVFLAIGAQLSRRTDIPAGDSARILDALGVLRGVAEDEPPLLGRRVVVYGGGNTAMDVARTARRLGATDAVVVYRRTRQRMPAQPFEVTEAEEEGVRMHWLTTITAAGNGTVTVEKMRLDETGFPQPTGEFEELPADSMVLAIGQDVDRSIVDGLAGVRVDSGVVQVGADMMTGVPGVFAGGDMVPSERTVTTAVGHGKRAARYIDAWLRGRPYQSPARPPRAAFERLNTWYYSDAPATVRPRLDAARRTSTFDEVVGGLDEDTALFEARRCLSCGNCFECDNCYGVCPDNAVIKLGPGRRYAIDLEYCKGCGICVTECPAGAIDLVPEEP